MVDSSASLSDIFKAYNGGKGDMDGKTFSKVAKDASLIDKKLTTTEIDLIFAKVKTSASVRTITYDQFEKGLEQWATKKGLKKQDVVAAIEKTGGPQFQGTKGASKFHDDKSTYTGMHVGKDSQPAQQEEEKAPATKKQSTTTVAQGSPAGSLEEVFTHFTAGAKDGMDGKTFAKLCKDCHLLDKKFTATDVDLIFAKCKDKSARKITYAQFQNCMAEAAKKKGCTNDEINEKVMSTGGPAFSGTKADKVKFHDDKNLYTGVHKEGGPSTVDKDKISDISQTCDRSAADVRGNKK